MTSDEAPDRLRELLRDAGVDLDRPTHADVGRTWDVMPFQFRATEELRALGEDNLWSFDLPLDAFFDKALAMPGFRGVRELGVDPLRLVIEEV